MRKILDPESTNERRNLYHGIAGFRPSFKHEGQQYYIIEVNFPNPSHHDASMQLIQYLSDNAPDNAKFFFTTSNTVSALEQVEAARRDGTLTKGQFYYNLADKMTKAEINDAQAQIFKGRKTDLVQNTVFNLSTFDLINKITDTIKVRDAQLNFDEKAPTPVRNDIKRKSISEPAKADREPKSRRTKVATDALVGAAKRRAERAARRARNKAAAEEANNTAAASASAASGCK